MEKSEELHHKEESFHRPSLDDLSYKTRYLKMSWRFYWLGKSTWITHLHHTSNIHSNSQARPDSKHSSKLTRARSSNVLRSIQKAIPSSVGFDAANNLLWPAPLTLLRNMRQRTSKYGYQSRYDLAKIVESSSNKSIPPHPNYDWREPAVSCRWTSWVWEITGWSSRLQENYRSF